MMAAVPEGLEVELYRRAAEVAVGRRIAGVDVDERLTVEPLVPRLVGARVLGTRRIGKVLLLDTDGPVLGLHFGMTGRIVVDGRAPIDRLEYGSAGDAARWDRLRVTFDDGGHLRVNDPRRWARFTLDPDTSRLGPDVLALTRRELAAALAPRRTSVKAVLLDQGAVAGLGNLCVDEVLWQAAIHPGRRADGLTTEEIAALHAVLRRELPRMLRRGGSHTGTVSPAVRADLRPCPRDGAPLCRAAIAGRTTVWCSTHQR
jgi:formamidopyrimidine-DNA glycosylase